MYAFVKYFNFFLVNFWMKLKFLQEYKASFYTAVFEQVFFVGVNLLFFSILQRQFADVVGWSFSQFVLFLGLVDVFVVFFGIFSWRNWLKLDITTGVFNLKLLRPLRVFWFDFFYSMSAYAILYCFLVFVMYLVLFWVFEVVVVNVLFGGVLFVLLGFFWISLFEFFRSLDWFFVGLSEILWRPIGEFGWNFKSFPAPFFGKFRWRFVFYFFPLFVLGDLFVPILSGSEVVVDLVWSYCLFFVFGGIFFCFLNKVVWSFGLKYYEGFG